MLSERASDIANFEFDGAPGEDLSRAVDSLRIELDVLKSTVAFPLSECRKSQ